PSEDHPCDGRDQTDQHDQRVTVEIARLNSLREHRAPCRCGGYPVRAKPVDQSDIDLLPEDSAEPEGGLHDDEVIELVEHPLAVDKSIDWAELLRDLGREGRVADITVPGDRETDQHDESRGQLNPVGNDMQRVDQRLVIVDRPAPEAFAVDE